ncbi:MAG: MarR family transcriptional regulator [Actinobacteria bacterium]|nr:MarR family transcriptional regulator [Actinomycetota bacterium]
MSSSLSKRRLRLWIRLLRITRVTELQLREFLRVQHESTLPRFDVMAALHRAQGELTMTGLSRRLLVSNGNTTTVIDRLEKDGLVKRSSSAADRRIVNVSLTAAGRRQFARLAAEHEAQVDALFGDISSADLDALEVLLARLDTKAVVHDLNG